MHTAMRIQRVVFVCIVLLGCSFVAMNTLADKQIFKTIDSDGNVVFSDVPPAPQQSGEPVELPTPNVFPAAPDEGKTADGREMWIVDTDSEASEGDSAPAQYLSLTIRAPANDANIRENTGSFSVFASLDPPLRPDHSLQLLLDKVPAATAGRDAIFTLSNVDRGTHTLQAQVVDDSGAVVFAGQPSVFHLQRYSKLTAPNAPKPKPR